jgi:hypothetical protein
MPNKPIRLRPMNPKHRAAFLVSVGLSVLVVVVAWGLNIRDVLRPDVMEIQQQIDTVLNKAAEGIVEIRGDAQEVTEEARESAEIFKETYDAEVERLNQEH